MTDPLSALRATVSAMTPGEWFPQAGLFGWSYSIRCSPPKNDGARVLDFYDGGWCGNPDGDWGPTKRQVRANATGIVSAVQIARFVADPESVKKVAAHMCCPVVCGKGDEPYAICQRHTFEKDAESVLDFIARAANAE